MIKVSGNAGGAEASANRALRPSRAAGRCGRIRTEARLEFGILQADLRLAGTDYLRNRGCEYESVGSPRGCHQHLRDLQHGHHQRPAMPECRFCDRCSLRGKATMMRSVKRRSRSWKHARQGAVNGLKTDTENRKKLHLGAYDVGCFAFSYLNGARDL